MKKITYNYSNASQEINIEHCLNKFRFERDPNTQNLTSVTKKDDNFLILNYNKDGINWTKTYKKNEFSFAYSLINLK